VGLNIISTTNKLLRIIFFLLILYLYIYNPIFQILNFGLIKILLLISISYLLLKSKVNIFFKLFKIELFFILLIIFYSFLRIIFWGTMISIPYLHIVWFLETFIISFYLVNAFPEKLNKININSIVVLIGTIASLISLYLILNPELNSYVRNNIIVDPIDSLGEVIVYRGFSIAENSSFGYGISQGIVLSICLFSIKKSKLFLVPIILIFISIIFNARTGVFPPILTMGLLFVTRNRINIKGIILVGLLILFIYKAFFEYNFFNLELDSIKWAFGFFTDSKDKLNGENSAGYDSLLGDFIFFPDSIIGIIFGDGDIVFGKNRNSDIGYINQIFFGGIFYLLLLVIFLIYIFKNFFKYNLDWKLVFVFLIVLIIANYKGNALFVPNSFNRVIILYYVLYKTSFNNKLTC
jgi:hypothetical protein